MSARYFCDGCGAEVQDAGEVFRRGLIIEDDKGNKMQIAVEIRHAVTQCWNSGHVCPACIIRVVNEGQVVGADAVVHVR